MTTTGVHIATVPSRCVLYSSGQMAEGVQLLAKWPPLDKIVGTPDNALATFGFLTKKILNDFKISKVAIFRELGHLWLNGGRLGHLGERYDIVPRRQLP